MSGRTTLWTRSALVALVLCGVAAGTAGAVAVSPLALYLDPRTRSGVLTLHNPGSLPAEVEIDFAFGYPATGADGVTRVEITPLAPDGAPAATGWLRAFPRRIMLEPGQRQTVRILIEPPADLPDGEYWARVMVRSTGGQPPIEQRQGNISMQLDLQMVIAVALSYRVGAVNTGLTVNDAAAAPAETGPALRLDLERQGNAAFLGRVLAELVAPDGRVVATATQDIAIYERLVVNVPFELPDPRDLRGHTVRYTIDTLRPDLPAGAPLPVPPIRDSLPVTTG